MAVGRALFEFICPSNISKDLVLLMTDVTVMKRHQQLDEIRIILHTLHSEVVRLYEMCANWQKKQLC